MSTSSIPSAIERRQLRRELRARRRAIQGTARWLRPGRRIGHYLPMDEEIDTTPLLQLARQRGCLLALPRITSLRHDRMRFFDASGGIRHGAFGILEPVGGRMVPARELDVVFMPLVGFDVRGNRIGMGRGFYDRHFAHRLRLVRWRRPMLIGLAYGVQQVDALPLAAHDVPVDAIVTESSTYRFPRSMPRCATG
jgi:5-formyltetrahydrofolate cyclo-ligase